MSQGSEYLLQSSISKMEETTFV